MIEAVGWQYFDTFFARCSRLLEPDGLMLLQAITIDDGAYEIEKGARSFANELIFPGGCLPSQEVIRQLRPRRATDMRILDVEDITASYPRTLRRWRENWLARRGRGRAARRRPPLPAPVRALLRLVARAASRSAASRTCRCCSPSRALPRLAR